MGKYAKFAVAVIAAAVLAAQAALVDGIVTSDEWAAIGIATLAALGVYVAPNREPVTAPAYDHQKRLGL